tara:strand:- start:20115 stop:20444 length:330 start_codon:yes stop_codon:yes gene_type:complete
MEEDKLVIRRLNDELRRTGQGGRVMITIGIQSRGPEFLSEVVTAMRRFDDFKSCDDPYGEHDFGALTVEGQSIFWKIDYYDNDLAAHSPDPADSDVTIRVLTVLLAEEY